MKLYAVIALLVTLSATQAEEPCRCRPDKMSGTVLLYGQFSHYIAIDYTRSMIAEMYKTYKQVYDLKAGKKYAFTREGGINCRTTNMRNLVTYAQCVPEHATLALDAPDTVTYTYETSGGYVDITKTMNKATCTPTRVVKLVGFSVQPYDYNLLPFVSDAPFDVDLSKCTE